MDEMLDHSSSARSLEPMEALREVKQEELDRAIERRPMTDHCSQCKSCLYAALRSISLDMLVNPEAGNCGKRCILNPEARTIIANVRQFFTKLKDHLGPDSVRGTIFSSVIAVTATACAVSDSTVEAASKRGSGPKRNSSGCGKKKKKLEIGQDVLIADSNSENVELSTQLWEPDMPP
ncbi:hypothetical protein COOONC_09914 [Cooperia oncophora]